MADLPNFDSAEHLKDDAYIAGYMSAVIDDGDAGQTAHAREMAQDRSGTAIAQEALYKALRAYTQPRFSTLTLSYLLGAVRAEALVRPAQFFAKNHEIFGLRKHTVESQRKKTATRLR